MRSRAPEMEPKSYQKVEENVNKSLLQFGLKFVSKKCHHLTSQNLENDAPTKTGAPFYTFESLSKTYQMHSQNIIEIPYKSYKCGPNLYPKTRL